MTAAGPFAMLLVHRIGQINIQRRFTAALRQSPHDFFISDHMSRPRVLISIKNAGKFGCARQNGRN